MNTKKKTRASSVVSLLSDRERREVADVIRDFKVSSLADGNLRVEPQYIPEPVEPGATVLGVLDRMALAVIVCQVLNLWLAGELKR